MKTPKLEAQWTDDCQDKKDYDAFVVKIDCRSYPPGAPTLMTDSSKPELGLHEVTTPGAKPDAQVTVYVQDEQVFHAFVEGETREEVHAKVEALAQQKFELIRAAVIAALKGE